MNEKKELEIEDAFAKERIREYCKAHRDLETEKETCMLSLDFTATQTSMQNKFCDFVLVVATHSPISMPDSLISEKVQPETPPSLKGYGNLVLQDSENKKTRRTKIEMMDVERPEVRPNLKSDIERQHKMKKLPAVQPSEVHFKPALTYLHFVIKRTAMKVDEDGDESLVNVTQTFDYVQWVLEYLAQHKFFEGFNRLKFWSDGCGKHFKTYNTHYFMASYQEQLKMPVTWDFLAPNRGLFFLSCQCVNVFLLIQLDSLISTQLLRCCSWSYQAEVLEIHSLILLAFNCFSSELLRV